MASSRDRSRSPFRPVSNALARVALGIVSEHETTSWLDFAETMMEQQRVTIRSMRSQVGDAQEAALDLELDRAETRQVHIELVSRLLARIQALETEVAELRARTAPQ